MNGQALFLYQILQTHAAEDSGEDMKRRQQHNGVTSISLGLFLSEFPSLSSAPTCDSRWFPWRALSGCLS